MANTLTINRQNYEQMREKVLAYDALAKRVRALEAENDELRKDAFYSWSESESDAVADVLLDLNADRHANWTGEGGGHMEERWQEYIAARRGEG